MPGFYSDNGDIAVNRAKAWLMQETMQETPWAESTRERWAQMVETEHGWVMGRQREGAVLAV